MALPSKTKGSWEFAQQTLSCNNAVDPLCPLAVMAAEKVAAHILADKRHEASTTSYSTHHQHGDKAKENGGDKYNEAYISTTEESEER